MRIKQVTDDDDGEDQRPTSEWPPVSKIAIQKATIDEEYRAKLRAAAAALPPRNVVLNAEESAVFAAAKTPEERTLALQMIAAARAKKAREVAAANVARNSPNAKLTERNRKARRRQARAARRNNRA